MEFSLVLLNKLISMSLMAVVGYVMVKVGTLKQEDSRVISLLLLFVIQPCMILRSLQIELTPDRLQGFLFATAASSLSMLFCILFAKLFQKVWDLDPVDRTSLTYANVGNLILPLISMSLGDEMVFYGSTFQVPFNLLLWTHCYSLFMGGKRLKLKKMLTNPPLIALGLGLFLLVTQLHLPGVIDTAAKGYHDMVAAASMLLVGMIIAGSDLKSVFTYKKAYLISLLRLVVLPVICILLLYVSGFVQRHPDMRPVALVVVIGASAPCGSSIVQMAVLGGKDAMKASIYNVMSTILCVVTIPMMIFLFQMLFPA